MYSFKKYLAEAAKDYIYVIKFAMHPQKEQLDIIESWLKRFDLRNSTPVSIVENDTKDFINIPNRHVHMMEVTLGTSVSQYMLLQDLKSAANISEDHMVVRSANEPIEVYARQDAWSRTENEKAAASGKISGPRLSTDSNYTKAEQPPANPLFGDDYNKKLLGYLAGVQNSRPVMELDAPAPLFSWLKMKEDIAPGEPMQDTADFNAHIDTPKPTSKGSKKLPIKDEFINSHNDMSNSSIPTVKFLKNKKTGKTTQVVQPVKKG